ncbi:contractile injection system protein, VgrG/Pvc8 family [Pseudomonas fluorescens]|uniref:Gp5/Type VI secretion system Vgr protein OB-fold domain-containing protein n=1 Tax=Pseudomonas fluorescens TaxID=294 RepID=A0A5E7D0Z4_PSEFL|nr:contractile injection system protein, VgrG/Pvc8 family [Pseudomonas fluorescens]VVO01272.1 hypothetical protein PS723_02658 [Pseudomonas fluorescens]
MSNPVSEPFFRLDIAGLPHPLNVLAFTGSESISEPFVFELHLIIDDPQLDLGGLMYRCAYLQVFDGQGGIHGQIHGLSQDLHCAPQRLCRVRLGPKLACLAQRYNQRVFTDLTVPEIIKRVLHEHGIREGEYCLELTGTYRARDYCTQYRESDLQFLQRLCAQERIHYHFQHQRRGHCVVFADTQRSFHQSDSCFFSTEGQAPAIRTFSVHAQLRADEPAERAEHIAEGQSDLALLRSGSLMRLSGHPFTDWNDLWLLTSVQHQGAQAAALESKGAFSGELPSACQYRNHFRATPREVSFVPPRSLLKPRMSGIQRAWVVDAAPAPQGMIAVQFDWLYQGQGSNQDPCWVPVLNELAGETTQGLQAGMEVLVSFAQGDPDQPLIIGFLPEAAFGTANVPGENVAAGPCEEPALLHADLDPARFVGAGQSIQLADGLELRFDTGSEMHFKVGNSTVKLDAAGLGLSSAQIILEARQRESGSVPIACSPLLLPEQEDLLTLVQASHPLMLLCLLPEGGSFTHCKQNVCTCRLLARAGKSGGV